MPIRDEKTYARMSLNDFKVAYERLKKGELRLSAFRAYKAERRMLQCLAMIHDLHRKDTPCAVPKRCMMDVAERLRGKYEGIEDMTSSALSLFDQWKRGDVDPDDVKELLVRLRYDWLKDFLDDREIMEIDELKRRL
ncbi:PaREP1 family protein [Sulfuracidifex tepidarius]|uniref:Uncharacterized protein n=1 Tax=Sulfuracidifex tepidarius TaxID=1294262 RepID=A0A510E5R3_9CREN|nr:PaREP1 family protein [Sulfuracidifex tepidarius]BBG24992.1 hypothetical protein IC006_2326 [Sulfuracidifex tepidarius]BBG27777.1 hypothetical protein IC007_2331 [Sulfuracidifex tepidarius]